MANRIKGILFDLGETLINYGPVNVSALFRAGTHLAYEHLKELGQPLPSFNYYHSRQALAIRWCYLRSHLIDREFNALDLILRLSRRMGQDISEEQALELAALWYRPLRQQAAVEPGTRQVLEELRRDGLALGLISNTFIPGAVLDDHLRREGLLDLLPVRVYSSDVGLRKPHRKIFALALRQANLAAGRTLFVGDSLRPDIRGANRAGMISVLKVPAGRRPKSRTKPRHQIQLLADLKQVVAAYNTG